MQVFLTFDYELYFGARTGSLQKCILEPTQLLLDIAKRQNIRLCMFVDVGYLLRLEQEAKKHPSLQQDVIGLRSQLDKMVGEGHDLQLHIHPHWEDSHFDGQAWQCDVSRYKLSDFDDQAIHRLFSTYKERLEKITGDGKVFAFRAGGWCIQPFTRLMEAMRANGIKLDSSVFPGGYFQSEHYDYDFRQAPQSSIWKFDSDPVIPDPEGQFTELPISSIRQSPLFYWRLFILGRLAPHFHKPLGDGEPIPAPGQRLKILTRYTTQTVSADGFNAHSLQRALNQQSAKSSKHLVVIGHPKALSRYSIRKLEEFIRQNKESHTFTTFLEQKKQLCPSDF
jgi:hypothetical protein